jgi:beta-glucanase (GH16 family)
MPLGEFTDANGTWHQIFTEDFDTAVPAGSFPGPAYRDKWDVYPDGRPDTSHNGTYYPSKVVSVSNGALNMYLHTELINGIAVHMVAAPVPHLPGRAGAGGQAYGRYSVRFKADPVRGYKTAWLLWPDSEVWPRDGEIDFPEGNLDGTIHAYMHYANPAGGQAEFRTGVTYPNWHIATIEWSPGSVTFILDGHVVGVSTSQVPFNPMHYVLQTETCLDCGPPSNAATGNVQVDWVVLYSRG